MEREIEKRVRVDAIAEWLGSKRRGGVFLWKSFVSERGFTQDFKVSVWPSSRDRLRLISPTTAVSCDVLCCVSTSE